MSNHQIVMSNLIPFERILLEEVVCSNHTHLIAQKVQINTTSHQLQGSKMVHHRGTAVGHSGHHEEHTYNQWMPVCQVCRLNDPCENPLQVKGLFIRCLGAARKIRRTLTDPVNHGERIHKECGEKCHILVWIMSSLSPPARLSRY